MFSKLTCIYTCILILGCGQPRYRASSGSMMNTILPEQEFTVTRTDDFNRNDIIVFQHEFPSWEADDNGERPIISGKKLLRLVGLPGDTLEIRDDQVYINGDMLSFPAKGLLPYEIGALEPIHALDKVADVEIYRSGDTFFYKAQMMPDQLKEIQDLPGVVAIGKANMSNPVPALASANDKGNWTSANYGPVIIPLPGESIEINEINRLMYASVPFMNVGVQVVKEKLYFLLGDNRHFSEDSRYIGLIPHSKMYGIVK